MSHHFSMKDMVDKGLQEISPGVWGKPTKGQIVAPKKGKGHKYGAKSKDVDGVHYDSTREYDFSQLLRQNGIEFKMKEEYVLQEGFTYTGEKIRTIRIIPDFGIYHNGKLVAIADPKGMIMPDFKLKVKLLKAYFVKTLNREVPIFMPTNKKEMAEVISELLKLISPQPPRS